MAKSSKRPIDLGIFHSRLPIGAWVSIVHRITGIVLVVLFPLVFFLFERSLTPDGFADLVANLGHPAAKLAVVVLTWLFAQHFYSGIRHLLLDIDVGIDRQGGRMGALAVFATSIATTVLVTLAWL